MPKLSSVTLNQGAGGSSVVTDQQSTGAQAPVSELLFSTDGVLDSQPVTGANPLPVGGAGIDEIRAATELLELILMQLKIITMALGGDPEQKVVQ
jgi:hypothetical protein